MTSPFPNPKPVVGVIHVGALPGTPGSSRTVAELVVSARDEAKMYRECGVDGVIIENMHDVPYMRGEVGPEIVAAMTAIAGEVKTQCGQAPKVADIQEAKTHCSLPVFLGSGIATATLMSSTARLTGSLSGRHSKWMACGPTRSTPSESRGLSTF